jgi:CDP-glucose 4,6-dehydratase
MNPAVLESLRGARALVTGHTGFKGAWLAAWLDLLGAEVHGVALAPPARGAFVDLAVASFAHTIEADVRDGDAVDAALKTVEPDIVFHLAAQPLVRAAWADRRATYGTNVMGTVNVLEAALGVASVRGVVVVTTDKVYENNEQGRAFVEGDRLGGHDPYSASKAAAEIAIGPYRRSDLMGFGGGCAVTSVRAGNVIGGGDWSADRLIPDIVRALEAGENITLRRPDAVRPWQHVLDCVHGYLLVAAAHLDGRALSPAYNFAHEGGAATVLEVTKAAVQNWGATEDRIVVAREDDAQEAGVLTLDPTLAHKELGWQPAWTLEESIAETIRIYRDPSAARAQIAEHMERSAAQ